MVNMVNMVKKILICTMAIYSTCSYGVTNLDLSSSKMSMFRVESGEMKIVHAKNLSAGRSTSITFTGLKPTVIGGVAINLPQITLTNHDDGRIDARLPNNCADCSSGFIEIHFNNLTDSEITVSVDINIQNIPAVGSGVLDTSSAVGTSTSDKKDYLPDASAFLANQYWAEISELKEIKDVHKELCLQTLDRLIHEGVELLGHLSDNKYNDVKEQITKRIKDIEQKKQTLFLALVKLNTRAISTWNTETSDINFQAYLPEKLPGELNVTEALYRPESADMNYPRCALKLHVSDANRKLSLKQFFYDWSPPAYGCPNLWKNHVEYSKVDIPEPISYVVDNDILWVGFNYRNKRAAAITKNKTLIEFTVVDGEFADEELTQIAKDLAPTAVGEGTRLKTFAELSYQYPQVIKSVNVPISFWSMPTERSAIKFQRAFNATEAPSALLRGNDVEMPDDENHVLDSVFVYHRTPHSINSDDRVEFIYRNTKTPGSSIRLLTSASGPTSLITYPPVPDETQKFRQEKLAGFSQEVHYAYRSSHFGPHEVVWQRNHLNHLLMVQPAPWANREWFIQFLRKIIK